MKNEIAPATTTKAVPLGPLIQFPDELLIKKSLKGDFKAFNQLTKKYMSIVFSMALRMTRHREDAEDVVQQTFLAALENLHKFRFEAAFSTWLIRIATNKSLKLIAKRKKNNNVRHIDDSSEESWEMNSLPEGIAALAKSPEELVQNNEIRVIWRAALDELSDKYRPPYILRDIQGFSTAETAEMLQLSESNVKIRLMRARLSLQKYIRKALKNAPQGKKSPKTGSLAVTK